MAIDREGIKRMTEFRSTYNEQRCALIACAHFFSNARKKIKFNGKAFHDFSLDVHML